MQYLFLKNSHFGQNDKVKLGLNNVLSDSFFSYLQLQFYGKVVKSHSGGHKLHEKQEWSGLKMEPPLESLIFLDNQILNLNNSTPS